MIRIDDFYINPANINYFKVAECEYVGYNKVKNYVVTIHFGSEGGILKLRTSDKDEFDEWVSQLSR